jgi:hypothetical protein
VVQDRDHWRVDVNTVMSLGFHEREGVFSSAASYSAGPTFISRPRPASPTGLVVSFSPSRQAAVIVS